MTYNIVVNLTGKTQPYADNTMFFDTNGNMEVHFANQIYKCIIATYTKEQLDSLFAPIAQGVQFVNGNTTYQTNVPVPIVNNTQLVTAEELTAHATHDANMFDQLAAQIVAGQLTSDQIQAIVDQAIQAANDTLVTQTQLTQAMQGLAAESGVVISQADTGVDPNGQYYLKATKYTNGDLIISGWVANCGDKFSAYFPTGYSFIDTNYSAQAICADTTNFNETIRALHMATLSDLRIDSFSIICSKFGVALGIGAVVGDEGKYSVSFTGRWK